MMEMRRFIVIVMGKRNRSVLVCVKKLNLDWNCYIKQWYGFEWLLLCCFGSG